MKILGVNSVSNAQVNRVKLQKNSSKINPLLKNEAALSFKGIEAGGKAILGTVLGLAIGALTGGIGAILFGGMIGCAGGAIKGSIDEAKNSDDDENTDDIDHGCYV